MESISSRPRASAGCTPSMASDFSIAASRRWSRRIVRKIRSDISNISPDDSPPRKRSSRCSAPVGRGGIAWTDMQILPEPSGQPRVTLSGECERIARELGITRWLISLSPIETHATAKPRLECVGSESIQERRWMPRILGSPERKLGVIDSRTPSFRSGLSGLVQWGVQFAAA